MQGLMQRALDLRHGPNMHKVQYVLRLLMILVVVSTSQPTSFWMGLVGEHMQMKEHDHDVMFFFFEMYIKDKK